MSIEEEISMAQENVELLRLALKLRDEMPIGSDVIVWDGYSRGYDALLQCRRGLLEKYIPGRGFLLKWPNAGLVWEFAVLVSDLEDQ